MFLKLRVQSCGYATLKDIQLRLKSIQNIGKITKSMKMIASTKLNRAQKSMETGRFYGSCALGIRAPSLS
jgi:F-type H+-transporting ATPase subunit gamma